MLFSRVGLGFLIVALSGCIADVASDPQYLDESGDGFDVVTASLTSFPFRCGPWIISKTGTKYKVAHESIPSAPLADDLVRVYNLEEMGRCGGTYQVPDHPLRRNGSFSGGANFAIGCTNTPTTIKGTQGTDILCGGSKGDNLYGLGSNDFANGMQGDDTVIGGSGNDVVRGGQGRDNVLSDYDSGANGSDCAATDLGDDYVLSGGSGFDYCYDPEGGAFQTVTCEHIKTTDLDQHCFDRVAQTNWNLEYRL